MHNLLLTDFISITNTIPKEICEDIINKTKDSQWQKHAWYNQVNDTSNSAEDKELDVLFPPPDITQLVSQYVVNAFSAYESVCKKLSAETNFSGTINQWCGIRLNRYNENTLMRPHFDHIHSLFDGQQKGIPVLSLVGLLNKDYEGGELTFFDDYKLDLKQGDIVVFPSCFLYPHKVNEITKGTRYSLVSWGW
jgi:hypothetical protein